MFGPDRAEPLGDAFPRWMFHSQYHVAQQAIIRSQPYGLVEVQDFISATRAAIGGGREGAHRAGAAWAGYMGLCRQQLAAGIAEGKALLGGQGFAAGRTDIWINQGEQALSKVAAKGVNLFEHSKSSGD